MIAATNGTYQIWAPDVELADLVGDVTIPKAPKVAANYLGFWVDGTMFDQKRRGEAPEGVVVPEMPVHVDSVPSQLQVELSNYWVDSLFGAFMQVTGGFSFWARGEHAPAYLPFQMTTSGFSYIFPGMEKMFGKDIPVDIEFIAHQADSFDVARGSEMMHAVFGCTARFWVKYPDRPHVTAVELFVERIQTAFSVKLEGLRVRPSANAVSIGDIRIKSESFGDWNLVVIKYILNILFKIDLSFFNNLIYKYNMHLPDTIMDGLF